MKKKKVPVRKCIACNESRPKKELVRVVRNKEGDVDVDSTGKMNGRGAYICSDAKCLEKAMKKKSLARALEIEIPKQVYEKLAKVIHSDNEQ